MLTLFGSRAPLENLGSPLVFKNPVPWESLASEGTRSILAALALEAPETVDGVVVITSTGRRQKPLSRFSWHHRFEAVDWRTGLYHDATGELLLGGRPGSIVAPSPEEALSIGLAWADRVRDRCGNEFDVVFGTDRRHIDHGHAERDGVKVARVFQRR